MKVSHRENRKLDLLFGLIRLFLQQKKPIGSNTLKENGFEHLSSATIRNYFSMLELEGYLKQHHISGGRIPTNLAYKLFAYHYLKQPDAHEKEDLALPPFLKNTTKDIAGYLQSCAETLSEMGCCSAFLSAPRFDQDFIVDVKFLRLNSYKLLCAIQTDFGMVKTEIFSVPDAWDVKLLESYFAYRLHQIPKPQMSELEEQFALNLYNEIFLRHLVSYTHFSQADIYKSGFAKLLNYNDSFDPTSLASALSLFENPFCLRGLLLECQEQNSLKFWIGEDLSPYISHSEASTIIAIPYSINNHTVGALALLGPSNLDYPKLFQLLTQFAKQMSDTLTQSLYKFQLNYRQPKSDILEIDNP